MLGWDGSAKTVARNQLKKEKAMKVKDLIEALKNLPPECDVYLWWQGTRLPVTEVDTDFVEEQFIDLMIKED